MIESPHQLWSVVIPTIWRSSYTLELLQKLNNEALVGEIILIDNAPAEGSPDLSGLHKIIHLPQRSNIYVNPAWNLGVSSAKYAQICICNDDILFNTSVFSAAAQHLLLEQKTTIIGAHHESFSLESDVSISFSRGHWVGQGWGCVLFFQKKYWRDIPPQLKIFSGDKYITTIFPNTHSIRFKVDTVMSSSSGSREFNPIKDKDRHNFELLTNYYSRAKWLCKHATSFGRFNLSIFLFFSLKNAALWARSKKQ